MSGARERAPMSARDLLFLYRARLAARTVLVQEALAMVGIAVGVALLFASQVASTSLAGSVERLTGEIVGDSQYQLDARGPAGFGEGVLVRVRALAGVAYAFPVLEQPATVSGRRGSRSVDLIGVDPRYVHKSGSLGHLSSTQLAAQQAIALPVPLAAAIGTGGLQEAEVVTGAGRSEVLVGTTLGSGEVGGLLDGQVALAPLRYAQTLTGMRGRITRVFVRAQPGRTRQVQAALAQIAPRARANLQPAHFDSTLFRAAYSSQNQGETLFSAISALVGFMFALSAMLVTVPSRRRLVEDLHPQGAARAVIVQILLFDAVVIGVAGCALGIALGELLSVGVFHSTPGYLSVAFPIGEARIVTWQSVAFACAAGLCAACVGVLAPLGDLLAGSGSKALSASARRTRRGGWARIAAGVACLSMTSAILAFRPQSAVAGAISLMLALVCLLPVLFDLIVHGCGLLQRRVLAGPVMTLAMAELRNPRTRTRSLAVAATAAVAVFGAVSVGGAQVNLQSGLHTSARGIDMAADVWAVRGGEGDLFDTSAFRGVDTRPLTRLAGVASVGVLRSGLLDWGERRLWVLGQPADSLQPISPTQLVSGTGIGQVDERIRAGGWAVLSQTLAAEHGLRVGDSFVLPAPIPIRLRVAALSTNLGWSPGAVTMASSDYARAWGSPEPSAYEIQLRAGASAAAVKREVARALGPRTVLTVETAEERERRHYALVDQGLARMRQIRLLILIAGAFAVAGALGTMLWQRRGLIAFMKVDGYRRGVLWRWLVCESALILLAGCAIGAVFGLYGQLLISHALATVTGLPVALGLEALIALTSLVLVGAVASAIVAVPGYAIAGVRPSTAGGRL